MCTGLRTQVTALWLSLLGQLCVPLLGRASGAAGPEQIHEGQDEARSHSFRHIHPRLAPCSSASRDQHETFLLEQTWFLLKRD